MSLSNPDQIKKLIPLLAAKFIQRVDVIAEQTKDGGYRPLRDRDSGASLEQFGRPNLAQHLSGERTLGHYVLDHEDNCKLFVLDIDLTKSGFVPTIPLVIEPLEENYSDWVASFVFVQDLRSIWHSRDRKDLPARDYIKWQFRQIGDSLAASIHSQLDLPTAVAYTGNKGIHVYGFTGKTQASVAKDAAEFVLATQKVFEPSRGDNFYADTRSEVIPVIGREPDPAYVDRWATRGPVDTFDPYHFHNLHIEVFPKQRSLEGKDLGNLVRLPLGRNLHAPSDPTFFVDLTQPQRTFKPIDPVYALTAPNPWKSQADQELVHV